MNHTTMMNEIAMTTRKNNNLCQCIVSSYEEYCAKNNTFPFKDHANNEMIDSISKATSYEASIVQEVIDTMLQIVKTQVKSKLPFTK